MVNLYIRWIIEGWKTLKQVPPRWHDAVKNKLLDMGLDKYVIE